MPKKWRAADRRHQLATIPPLAPERGYAASRAVNVNGTRQSDTTFVGLNHPVPGTYTIVPAAGSPAITSLQVSRGYATPRVAGRIGGQGRRRTLRYRIGGNAPGTTIVFVERGPAGDVPIGSATGGSGRLRFTSAKGPGGRREIIAEATHGGPPVTVARLGSYVAPAIPQPGGVGHLRAARADGRRGPVRRTTLR